MTAGGRSLLRLASAAGRLSRVVEGRARGPAQAERVVAMRPRARARRCVAGAVLLLITGACDNDTSASGDHTSTSVIPTSTTVFATTSLPEDSIPDTTTVDFEPPAGGPFVAGAVEFWEFVAACAAQSGAAVNVIYSVPPAVEWTDPTGRTSEVVDRCIEIAETQDWIVPNPFDGSAEGNRLMYRLWLQVYDCLNAHGYPTKQPPSEDAFVENPDLWNPYAAMIGSPLIVAADDAAPGDATQLEAQRICGADAATLYQRELQEQAGTG
jgi:hypothetical protein